jgi:uncharacterized membrane protein (UPF0127 family)
LAGATLAACGRGNPTAPVSSPSSTPVGAITPKGLRAVVIQVTHADGTVESYCVWLADTEPQREQGLMRVTSLGGADGMLFRFGADQSGAFWMKDTVLPLSIAFFDGDGALVSATDMNPCSSGTSACPTYAAAASYADALEVPLGDLDHLGISPAARLAVTNAACEPGG